MLRGEVVFGNMATDVNTRKNIPYEGDDLPIKNASVCVIIPFFNGSKYIQRAIDSVLAQSAPPDEFLIVDDGSSPAEARQLHNIAGSAGVRVVTQANGGQGAARNFGVSNTSSRFICFLDQDDFFLKDHIEILLRELPENDQHLGWIYGDLMEADGEGNIIRGDIVKRYAAHPKRSVEEMVSRDMFVLPSAALIERNAFISVGGFDEQFTGYEDDDLFLRMFRAGFTNYYIDRPVTVWCINQESTSYSVRMSRSRLKYIKKLHNMFCEGGPSDRTFVLDVIIPRFEKLIIADAISASITPTLNHHRRMQPYREELIDILDQYANVVWQHLSLGKRLSLQVKIRLIKSNYRHTLVLATKCYLLFRRITMTAQRCYTARQANQS